MTNYERMKTYSVKEIASEINSIYARSSDFPPCEYCVYEECLCDAKRCEEGIIKWLMSEESEADNDKT